MTVIAYPSAIPTEPGAYEGMTHEQYAAIPAVSRSLLSSLADSPADAREFLSGSGESTRSLEFGIGSHCLLLEPEKFSTHFAIGPDVKLNTREGKLAWEIFTTQNPGKRHIRGADGADMVGLRAMPCRVGLEFLRVFKPQLQNSAQNWQNVRMKTQPICAKLSGICRMFSTNCVVGR